MDRDTVSFRARGQLPGGPGLSDPGLAGEEGELPPARVRCVELALERCEELGAPDEAACRLGCARSADLPDGMDEAEAPPAAGLDEARVLGVVRERAAQVAERARQGGLAHRDPGPERREELLLRHDPVAADDQESEQRQGLRLDRQEHTGPAQGAESQVELELSEPVSRRHDSHASPAETPAGILQCGQGRNGGILGGERTPEPG